MTKQSPIFSKTYDFMIWLIPLTLKFPRQQRFVMAEALQRAALQFQALLIEAAHQRQPADALVAADIELDKVRTRLRMSLDLKLIGPGQYAHAARMLTEIGKLLGGWKNSVSQTSAARGQQAKPAAPPL